ncbi:uncharacterized protein LOC110985727 [Acanthaster planci]|uniref:Uncharacterized protein LOC110985727 n=1 Tax=Acanthaster planci TaxID=133434 RepID=A0A8B7ZAE7_ACAPL|nr:uncharacterized protein LOC110985727 [Acanthaster planci]
MENLSPSPPVEPSSPWAERRLSQIACEAGSKKQSPSDTCTRPSRGTVSRTDSVDSFHVTLDYAETSLYTRASPGKEFPKDRAQHQYQQQEHHHSSTNAHTSMANGAKPVKRLKHPADQSLILPLIGTLVFVFLALATCIPVLLVTFVAVPVAYGVRRLVSCRHCACVGCPNLVSAVDRYWLYETELNQAVNQCLLHLEGSLEVTRLRDLLLARLISAENRRGSKLYSRFTQRVIPAGCGYQWSNDDNFNIDNHIIKVAESFRTKADVVRYVSELSCQAFQRDRPLWEMHVLQLGQEQPDTLLLFRIHACVSDGVNLNELLHKALADTHTKSPVNVPRKTRFGRRAFAFNAIRALIVGPLVVIRQILCGNEDFSLFRERRMTGQKEVTWSDAIHLPPVYRVKLVTRCTLNDVVMSAVAGSLRLYLQSSGVDRPKNIHSNMAVDFRGSELQRGIGPMGNHFTLVNVKLPTSTEGAIPRLWDTKRRMDELKLSAEHVVLYGMTQAVLTTFPESVAQGILTSFFGESSCTVSNLALGEDILSLGGKHIKMILYWMSPGDEVPISISILTYAGQMRVAVQADKGIVPNPQLIADEFKRQIETLVSLLAHRRIPGEYRRRAIDEDEDEDEEMDPLEEEIRTPSSASGRKNRPLSANCLQRPGSRSSSIMRPLSTSTDINEANGALEGVLGSSRETSDQIGGKATEKRAESSCSMECVSFSAELSHSEGEFAFDISPSVERRNSAGHLV